MIFSEGCRTNVLQTGELKHGFSDLVFAAHFYFVNFSSILIWDTQYIIFILLIWEEVNNGKNHF